MKNLFQQPSTLFLLAIALGLIYPVPSKKIEILLVPALLLAMTLSLKEIDFVREDLKEYFPQTAKLFLINYGLLSTWIIVLASLFLKTGDFFDGFIVVAAVPPAVAVIPFTYLLKGDLKESMLGESFSYIASLLLAPLILLIFLGVGIDLYSLFRSLGLFILLPLLASRILKKEFFSEMIGDYSKPAVNVSLGIVIYVIIGLNQEIIVSFEQGAAVVFAICFLRTFVTGLSMYYFTKDVSYSLFASYKNAGLAAAFAISLLNPQAALPAAVSCLFEILFIVFFKRLLKN